MDHEWVLSERHGRTQVGKNQLSGAAAARRLCAQSAAACVRQDERVLAPHQYARARALDRQRQEEPGRRTSSITRDSSTFSWPYGGIVRLRA